MDAFQDFLSRIGPIDVSGAANLFNRLAQHPLLPCNIVPGTLVAGQLAVIVKHGLGRPIYAGLPIGQSVGAALSVQLVKGSTNQTDVIVQLPAGGALATDVSFLLFCF